MYLIVKIAMGAFLKHYLKNGGNCVSHSVDKNEQQWFYKNILIIPHIKKTIYSLNTSR